mgnify:CR=1 FL=1
MDITELLAFSVKHNASDLHLSAGLPPMIRVDGDIRRINVPVLDHKTVHALIYDIMNDKQRKDYEEFLETDFSFAVPGLARFRVNAFNQDRGASAVFRTIPSIIKSLEDLNCPTSFKELINVPRGLILVTGPTGSGKTTTVYSCLHHITNPQMSIVTAEEPVEYVIDGISQCSINPKIGLTYQETLRHILRQDPDVIVIGEIRDNFSAEVAVQAALTGHKVLTTFHTEDSVGGLIRLLNMSIEAFMISSTVVSVMSQRLLRKACPICAKPHVPTSQELQRLGYSFNDITGAQFQKGQGCTNCQHSGYNGRVGIYELLILDQLVRDAILEHRPSKELRQISTQSAGLITLLEDGIIKAAEGITTIDELLRSLPRLQPPRPMVDLRRLI